MQISIIEGVPQSPPMRAAAPSRQRGWNTDGRYPGRLRRRRTGLEPDGDAARDLTAELVRVERIVAGALEGGDAASQLDVE